MVYEHLVHNRPIKQAPVKSHIYHCQRRCQLQNSTHLRLKRKKNSPHLVNIKENWRRHHQFIIFHLIRECKARKVMAEKRCASCSEWQEHYYREHMDDVSKIRFFKLMTGDFAHGISIPEKFAKSFNGQINKGIHLKAPSGKTWRVGVTKVANELFLMSGWDDFAKAHELQENDLMFFTYSGKCSFDVLIFDASGCEKVSCFFTGKEGPYMRKHFDNLAGRHAEHCVLSDSDDTNVPSRLAGSPHKGSTSKKLSGKAKTKPRKGTESPNSSNYHVKSEAIEEEESDDEHSNTDYYYSRFANYLTGEEREEIFSLVSLKPGNPAFVTVLKEGHIHRKNILITPSGFAADHLETKSHEILLIRPNRKEKWYVKYYYHATTTRGFNCHHWLNFVRDNKLHQGYICIFELMKGAKRTTMTVHVIGKVGNRFVLLG